MPDSHDDPDSPPAPHAPPAQPDEATALVLREQARGLLKLAETDLRAAEDAFGRLGFDNQLTTALTLTGDELHNFLQLSTDLTELVRALPPEHLHQAVRLIGAEDALDLLQAATSEQMQQLTDIEWFTEGRLDRKKVRRWLELLMELKEDEADQVLQGLDVNALAQFIRPQVRFAVDKDNLLLALHLNQRYLFTPDDLEAKNDFSRRLLDYLYSVDRDLFGDVLALLICDEEEQVENDMYGGREDRLLKRGFPSQAAAEFLLQDVDFKSYGIGWPAGVELVAESAVRGLETVAQRPAPFLLTAVAWGRATKKLGERTERELIKESADLANSLLLAHTKDSGDPTLRTSALLAVHVVSSVALEALSSPGRAALYGAALSDGQLNAAVEELKQHELRELFRIGWALTREVARDAWKLAFDERIERLGLARNLKWLPATLRTQVLDAEDLMSWKRIAAAGATGESGATESKSASAGASDKAPEPLTWPRLVRLRHAVWIAQTHLAEKERGAE